MCSPGGTLQHIYLSDPSGDEHLCWGGPWTASGLLLGFMGFPPECWKSSGGKTAGPILSLSPRLSNWNLSLQNKWVQGLAGYCTQGTDCSSKGPLAFKPKTTLFKCDRRLKGKCRFATTMKAAKPLSSSCSYSKLCKVVKLLKCARK